MFLDFDLVKTKCVWLMVTWSLSQSTPAALGHASQVAAQRHVDGNTARSARLPRGTSSMITYEEFRKEHPDPEIAYRKALRFTVIAARLGDHQGQQVFAKFAKRILETERIKA